MPDPSQITIVIDGVEVEAPRGQMLVDAAKHGDVEIPVFCYEPKLGDPVGACRMCMVEIEGIPKLQTACSTPVRDGMVVYTQTDRVKEAQNAVVEFLLVNHPLDCPVCDKGGECPLQDISMGWGPGKSRSIDPKRHFQKPIPLSPLIKIDRERCILCYRCVRFSQEVAEDEQLQLLERGAVDLRRHLRRPPLHRPLPRQHRRALPGGRTDRARPTASGPAPGTSRTPARSARCAPASATSSSRSATSGSQRVLARDNLEVDDGWLCDKGRFGFQMIDSARADHRAPGPRRRRASRRRAGREAIDGRGRGPARRGRAHRGDRRRLVLQRGGLPRRSGSSAGRSARRTSTRRAATGGAPARDAARRAVAPGARAPRSPTSTRADADPRDRHRPASRDADPRPANPQGGAPQRARLAVATDAHGARRRRRGDGPLRARARPRLPAALAARARRRRDYERAGGELGADAERIAVIVWRPGPRDRRGGGEAGRGAARLRRRWARRDGRD